TRDPLLEAGHGRIRQPAVDVAVLLQCEPGRGILGPVEDEGRGLVDGQGARPAHRIRNVPRVDCPGSEAVLAIRHGFTLPSERVRRVPLTYSLQVPRNMTVRACCLLVSATGRHTRIRANISASRGANSAAG